MKREADNSEKVEDRQECISNLSYDDLVLNQCQDMDEAMQNEVIQVYERIPFVENDNNNHTT